MWTWCNRSFKKNCSIQNYSSKKCLPPRMVAISYKINLHYLRIICLITKWTIILRFFRREGGIRDIYILIYTGRPWENLSFTDKKCMPEYSFSKNLYFFNSMNNHQKSNLNENKRQNENQQQITIINKKQNENKKLKTKSNKTYRKKRPSTKKKNTILYCLKSAKQNIMQLFCLIWNNNVNWSVENCKHT